MLEIFNVKKDDVLNFSVFCYFSLQVWYMAELSHIFANFDEVGLFWITVWSI